MFLSNSVLFYGYNNFFDYYLAIFYNFSDFVGEFDSILGKSV